MLALLFMSLPSRTWVIVDADGGDLHIGLWAEETCSSVACHKVEGSEREGSPKAGWLGTPILMLGLATAVALLLQLYGLRLRGAMYLGAAGAVVATFMVFGDEGRVPGPAYLTFVIACVASTIASALLPVPLPRSIPPRPPEPPHGGSAMQPPPDA